MYEEAEYLELRTGHKAQKLLLVYEIAIYKPAQIY